MHRYMCRVGMCITISLCIYLFLFLSLSLSLSISLYPSPSLSPSLSLSVSVPIHIHYGGKQIGPAGPTNMRKHRNAPSGMKGARTRNLQEIWNGFERQLVAICR